MPYLRKEAEAHIAQMQHHQMIKDAQEAQKKLMQELEDYEEEKKTLLELFEAALQTTPVPINIKHEIKVIKNAEPLIQKYFGVIPTDKNFTLNLANKDAEDIVSHNLDINKKRLIEHFKRDFGSKVSVEVDFAYSCVTEITTGKELGWIARLYILLSTKDDN